MTRTIPESARFEEFRYWLYGTMLFPRHEQLKKNWVIYALANETIKSRDPGESLRMSVEDVTAILNAPAHVDMRELERKAGNNGWVAGQLLFTMYLMDHFHVPEPSMNKAVSLAQQFAKHRTFGDGIPQWTSDRPIRDAWRESKAVAHLWAAYLMNSPNAYPYCPLKETFSTEENIGKFLGVAKTLMDFGTTYAPPRPRDRKVLLDGDDLWWVSTNRTPIPLKFNPENPPDLLLSLLEGYRT